MTLEYYIFNRLGRAVDFEFDEHCQHHWPATGRLFRLLRGRDGRQQ
jgi:hypothetical protein